MEKILILVSNKTNYALLVKELSSKYTIINEKNDIKNLNFDLIIIDGVELKKRQKELLEIKKKVFPLFLPVILLTTKDDLSLAEKTLYEIVDDLIRIPIEKIELKAKLYILLRTRLYTLILEQETVKDPLTGAYNKRFFYKMLENSFEDFKRYEKKFSIIFIDIDNFKKINDQYGHITGDLVLKTLVMIIKKNLRKNDLVFRFGGEEFVVLLAETDAQQAIEIAERIREAVAKEQIEINPNQTLSITISCGVAAINKDIVTPQDLIEIADNAMYKAKKEGKNRVCCLSNL
ncbi:GGDEF domain-containing protein [Thermodesulfobacterium thermophilum]|uniref:GGDEF domain-containing protein n=1 Tax=Thermodesulfobacterium thermophilum TaxID=886 RepID=UPI0003B4627F|nr:GGDEF domain-containing protein [Thermodesulfobacterium thermophilum]